MAGINCSSMPTSPAMSTPGMGISDMPPDVAARRLTIVLHDARIFSSSVIDFGSMSKLLFRHPYHLRSPKRGYVSLKSSHDAFEPTKIWLVLLHTKGVSTVPRRRRFTSGRSSLALYIGLPQLAQKTLALPGVARNSLSSSAPASTLNRAESTGLLAAKAEPCALR